MAGAAPRAGHAVGLAIRLDDCSVAQSLGLMKIAAGAFKGGRVQLAGWSHRGPIPFFLDVKVIGRDW